MNINQLAQYSAARVVLAYGLLALAGPTLGQELELLDPDLGVTVFSTTPTVGIVLPGQDATEFPGFIYSLSRTESPRINEFAAFDANGTQLLRYVVGLDAAALSMGEHAYAGRLFASDFALPDAVPDGIYEVAPDGAVTQFSDLGGGNPDAHGIAFGSGVFGDHLYVANPTAGSANPDVNLSIARVGSDGTVLGALVTDPDGPYYLAFPPAGGGPYGDYLYYTLLASSQLMRVDAFGNTEVFATFEAGEQPITLVFGRGGASGDGLYVTVNHPDGFASRRIARVLPDGSIETVGYGLRGFRLGVDPDAGDLFLANEGGGILRISGNPCEGAGDAGRLRFTSANLAVPEEGGTVDIEVERICGSAGAVSVDYLLAPGSATPVVDYLHPPGAATPQTDGGTLQFADGVVSQSITLEMVDNDLPDGDRDLTIILADPTADAEVVEPNVLAVTILDDEAGATVRDLAISVYANGNLNNADPRPENDGFTVTVRNAGSVTVPAGIVFEFTASSPLVGLGAPDRLRAATCEASGVRALRCRTTAALEPDDTAQFRTIGLTLRGISNIGTGSYRAVLLYEDDDPANNEAGGNFEVYFDPNRSMCFVATAAYGSPLAPHVKTLRQFRDRWLLPHPPGRLLVHAYYRVSPPLADWIAEREWARAVARVLLTPVVWIVAWPGTSLALVMLVWAGTLRIRRHRSAGGPFAGSA